MEETQFVSLGWEDPLEKGMTTHSSTIALENPLDRGAWSAAVHGVTESDTPEQLPAHERCCINADPTVLTLLLTLSPLKMKCAFK